jgi:hypothetical protein
VPFCVASKQAHILLANAKCVKGEVMMRSSGVFLRDSGQQASGRLDGHRAVAVFGPNTWGRGWEQELSRNEGGPHKGRDTKRGIQTEQRLKSAQHGYMARRGGDTFPTDRQACHLVREAKGPSPRLAVQEET